MANIKAIAKKILDEEIAKGMDMLGLETIELIKKGLKSGAFPLQKLSDKYKEQKRKDGHGDQPVLIRTGDSLKNMSYRIKKKKGVSSVFIVSDVYEEHAEGAAYRNLPIRDVIGPKAKIPGYNKLVEKVEDDISEKSITRLMDRLIKEGIEFQ